MSETVLGGLLVGVDGSEQSLEAVDWAAREAATRRDRLTVCYVSDIGAAVGLPLAPEIPSGSDRHSDKILAGALARAARVAPDVALSGLVVNGAPAHALVELGGNADQIVVGHRGLGGFAQVLLGSISGHVAAYASVPVVVVRATNKPDGPVLVGIDRADAHRPTLSYAFEYAARHQLGIEVLHAFHDPITAAGLAYRLPDADDGHARQAAAEFLSEATAAARAQFPQVQVEQVALGGSPAQAIVEASLGASLVVIGRRGVSGLAGLLLGSVSQAVIRHAHSPVAVVG